MGEIVRKKLPEEEELERKQQELAILEKKLGEVELELSTHQGVLSGFNATYLNHLGGRYLKIDELKHLIAQAIVVRLDDQDLEELKKAKQAAEEAAGRARATAEDVHEFIQPKFEPEPFKPSEVLKKLFRKVARMVHPDLARDEGDRKRREGVMAEANAAYKAGNMARLEAILQDADLHADQIPGEGLGAQLVRVIRQISAARRRIDLVHEEINQLKEIELYKFHEAYANSLEQGRDLLEEMGQELDNEIKQLEERLRELESDTAG